MTALSIIIPIYNEAQILVSSITRLHRELLKAGFKRFEIILSENGSKDNTIIKARQLARRVPEVKVISSGQPHFGKAFVKGVTVARYSTIVLFNADWWDVSFLIQAVTKLTKYSIVVGSKRLSHSSDSRPFPRRVGSLLLTNALKLLFHFSGSDSHGLKVFRTKELKKLIKLCITDEIIESEILIRAQRSDIPITEIPVTISEIRPARINFFIRCLKVTHELIRLRKSLTP